MMIPAINAVTDQFFNLGFKMLANAATANNANVW